MTFVRYHPGAPLDTVVECFWWSERRAALAPERMLPTGAGCLVVLLDDAKLSWLAPSTDEQIWWSRSIVHGPQTTYYTAGAKPAGSSVGVAFRPGALGAVLGIPAVALVDRHVSLEDIWGNKAAELQQRLSEVAEPQQAFILLERELLSSLKRRPLLIHPAIAQALLMPPKRLCETRHGYSDRHFIKLFKTAVGLTPGHYFRIRRFSAVLKSLARGRPRLAELAAEYGYADQSHLNREFKQLSGTTPSRYLPRSVDSPHHHSLSGQ